MNAISEIGNALAANPRELIAQAVGFLPMILAFFVYLFNDRRKVIGFKLVSDLLWALHFALLGESSGCVINLINTVRNVIFTQKGKRWASHVAIPVFFCVISAISTIFSWNGVKSLLPMAGSCLAVIGFWCSKPYVMRRFNLPGVVLWLIYGILTLSVSTIICNLVSIVSMLIAEWKYRKGLRATC